MPYILGMVLGNAVWLIVATLGLAALALRFGAIFVAVKWLGIAYLVFIAWKLWSADSLQAQLSSNHSVRRGILTGSFLTLSNPKAVIFFGAVLPHAFDMTALSLSEIGLIASLGIAIDLTIQLVYLAAASKVRNAVRSPTAINQSGSGIRAEKIPRFSGKPDVFVQRF